MTLNKLFLFFIFFSSTLHCEFGPASISKELFDFIRQILPAGKTILELGSGWTTGEFARYYTMYSIEHDKEWVGKYNSSYIYAPIKNSWYDVEIVKNNMPREYDLIIVDGPPGTVGREGFYKNLSLFKQNVPVVIDDIHRLPEYLLMKKLEQALTPCKTVIIPSKNNKKKAAILLPHSFCEQSGLDIVACKESNVN